MIDRIPYKIHQNDIGTRLVFDLNPYDEVDLNPGDVMEGVIIVKKPSGEIVEWPAAVENTTLVRVTEYGDIDLPGYYKFQPQVRLTSGWTGYGEFGEFLLKRRKNGTNCSTYK